MFTAETWPAACTMLPFGGAASDRTPPRHQAPSAAWTDHRRRVCEPGFSGPFCSQHGGLDSVEVCAEGREHIQQIPLPARRPED